MRPTLASGLPHGNCRTLARPGEPGKLLYRFFLTRRSHNKDHRFSRTRPITPPAYRPVSILNERARSGRGNAYGHRYASNDAEQYKPARAAGLRDAVVYSRSVMSRTYHQPSAGRISTATGPPLTWRSDVKGMERAERGQARRHARYVHDPARFRRTAKDGGGHARTWSRNIKAHERPRACYTGRNVVTCSRMVA